MKLRNHKTVVITSIIGIIYAAGLGFAYNEYVNKPLPALQAYVQPVSATPVVTNPVKPVEKAIEPATTTTETQKTEDAKPAILSTQEYGEKYLDLSTPQLQECFDNIVMEFPERFTEDVRENNVKALRAFGSTCSTGATSINVDRNNAMHRDSLYNTIIYRFGPNGAFFDSDIAKTAAN